MKITKFEHACFIVEQDGESLIIDPGGFTTDLVIPDNIVAIVVTHEHADHFDTQKLSAIVDANPDTVIAAHPSITAQLDGFSVQPVAAGEDIAIGNFHLEFYGGDHAVIDTSIPVIANLGVMINSRVYYPGDSFIAPDRPVELLALPIAAPWLKISEVMEFLRKVRPEQAFPTHDAILSDAGKSLPDAMLPAVAEQVGTKYQRLIEPLDLAAKS